MVRMDSATRRIDAIDVKGQCGSTDYIGNKLIRN